MLADVINMVRDNKMVAEGVVPPSFRYKARCIRCGPVLVPAGDDLDLVGCPWCWVAKKNLLM